jgi:hypothetical protein
VTELYAPSWTKEVLVDDFRRRPPMEGFTRPGSIGGEAWDDDSVEGHIMDDKRQDTDTEGHAIFKGEEDTEGHAVLKNEDDTEGHGLLKNEDDTEGHAVLKNEDDTEGHVQGGWLKESEDDDTEGHAGRIK